MNLQSVQNCEFFLKLCVGASVSLLSSEVVASE